MAFTDWTCETCKAEGRRGYCCPGRCYCGHESCHAFTSWTPRPDLSNVIDIKPKRNDHTKRAWDERSGDGWIDKF